MPQEPKKRHSRQRQGKRRASIKFKTQKAIACANCGNLVLPHTVCKKCGFYRGKSVVKIKTEEKNKETK